MAAIDGVFFSQIEIKKAIVENIFFNQLQKVAQPIVYRDEQDLDLHGGRYVRYRPPPSFFPIKNQ
jgi:hypothetical protein